MSEPAGCAGRPWERRQTMGDWRHAAPGDSGPSHGGRREDPPGSGSGPNQPLSVWLEELATIHRHELVRHARRRLGSLGSLGEDLVADVLGDLACGRFDSRSVPRRKALPFAKRVVSFEAMHLLREVRRFKRLAEHLRDKGSGDAWETSHRAQVSRDVARALHGLAANQRRAIERLHLLGWSIAEIADAEGVRENVIWQRLARGRRSLRRLLRHHNPLRDN